MKRARLAAYYLRNRESKLTKNRANYTANRERALARQSARRDANPAKVYAISIASSSGLSPGTLSYVGAQLQGQSLKVAAPRADFTVAVLVVATLDGHFGHATFAGADCRGATFRGTFRDADFVGCDLTDADFTGAHLADCVFSGCVLKGVKWPEARMRRCAKFIQNEGETPC